MSRVTDKGHEVGNPWMSNTPRSRLPRPWKRNLNRVKGPATLHMTLLSTCQQNNVVLLYYLAFRQEICRERCLINQTRPEVNSYIQPIPELQYLASPTLPYFKFKCTRKRTSFKKGGSREQRPPSNGSKKNTPIRIATLLSPYQPPILCISTSKCFRWHEGVWDTIILSVIFMLALASPHKTSSFLLYQFAMQL